MSEKTSISEMEAFLACVIVLLKQDLSSDDIGWDNYARRLIKEIL